MNKETQKTIAMTIISQLGGGIGKVIAMIGAKGFVFGTNDKDEVFVTFKHMKGKGGVNHCRITLNADDTYTMEHIKIHGMKVTTVQEESGVYNVQLSEIFTRHTDLELGIPTFA